MGWRSSSFVAVSGAIVPNPRGRLSATLGASLGAPPAPAPPMDDGRRYRLLPSSAAAAWASSGARTDERLGRDVAVKIVHDWVADDRELAAPVRARGAALARLQHPHVVRLYDVDEARRAHAARDGARRGRQPRGARPAAAARLGETRARVRPGRGGARLRARARRRAPRPHARERARRALLRAASSSPTSVWRACARRLGARLRRARRHARSTGRPSRPPDATRPRDRSLRARLPPAPAARGRCRSRARTGSPRGLRRITRTRRRSRNAAPRRASSSTRAARRDPAGGRRGRRSPAAGRAARAAVSRHAPPPRRPRRVTLPAVAAAPPTAHRARAPPAASRPRALGAAARGARGRRRLRGREHGATRHPAPAVVGDDARAGAPGGRRCGREAPASSAPPCRSTAARTRRTCRAPCSRRIRTGRARAGHRRAARAAEPGLGVGTCRTPGRADARRLRAREAGFTPVRRYAPSLDVAAWHVAETRPAAARASDGPPRSRSSSRPGRRVRRPDVRGGDADDASTALEQAGFAASVEEAPSSPEVAGHRARAPARARHARPVGSTVTVVVAREPRWETVRAFDGDEDATTDAISVPPAPRRRRAGENTSFLGFLRRLGRRVLGGDDEGSTELDSGREACSSSPRTRSGRSPSRSSRTARRAGSCASRPSASRSGGGEPRLPPPTGLREAEVGDRPARVGTPAAAGGRCRPTRAGSSS